jgi:Bacterial regulatory helix-turn-helix protein, lysR family
MELRHLRYFVAVAEALNFTKAATHLRVAQPALSRQVADLEDELGVDLLNRTSHGVRLTEEGKLFLAEARAVLNYVNESVTKVRALARGEFGELQVGRFASPVGSGGLNGRCDRTSVENQIELLSGRLRGQDDSASGSTGNGRTREGGRDGNTGQSRPLRFKAIGNRRIHPACNRRVRIEGRTSSMRAVCLAQ